MRAVPLTDFVNGDDVRMIERGSGARFLFETAQAIIVAREFSRGET